MDGDLGHGVVQWATFAVETPLTVHGLVCRGCALGHGLSASVAPTAGLPKTSDRVPGDRRQDLDPFLTCCRSVESF